MYRKLQAIYMFIILFVQILCIWPIWKPIKLYLTIRQLYIQISTITVAKLFFIDGLCAGDLFIHVGKESSWKNN